MDFEVLLEAIFALIRNSESMSFVFSCILVCMLSQVVKVVFVPKLRIDLLNKFDISVILPFIIGSMIALCDALLLHKSNFSDISVVYDTLIKGLTIGATSTIMYRLWIAFFSENLTKLQKDELFGAIYNEVMLFSTAKQKLLNGEMTFKIFVSQISLIKVRATDIYSNAQLDSDTKRMKLIALMQGVVDDDVLVRVADNLHIILTKLITIKPAQQSTTSS